MLSGVSTYFRDANGTSMKHGRLTVSLDEAFFPIAAPDLPGAKDVLQVLQRTKVIFLFRIFRQVEKIRREIWPAAERKLVECRHSVYLLKSYPIVEHRDESQAARDSHVAIDGPLLILR